MLRSPAIPPAKDDRADCEPKQRPDDSPDDLEGLGVFDTKKRCKKNGDVRDRDEDRQQAELKTTRFRFGIRSLEIPLDQQTFSSVEVLLIRPDLNTSDGPSANIRQGTAGNFGVNAIALQPIAYQMSVAQVVRDINAFKVHCGHPELRLGRPERWVSYHR